MQPKRLPNIKLIIVMTFLLLVGWSLGLHSSALAQVSTPPVSTPDPTMTSLNDKVATQQDRIDTLTHSLEIAQQQQALEVDKVKWSISKIEWIGTTALAVLALLGIGTVTQATKILRRKISNILDKELYGLDPTMLTIYIRRGLDKERQRLEMSGLKNVRWYDDFTKASLRGVTIVPIASIADEKEFLTFLSAYPFDPHRAAFILYSTGGYRVTDKTIGIYDNLTLANTATTIASAILVVGRGLIPDPQIDL